MLGRKLFLVEGNLGVFLFLGVEVFDASLAHEILPGHAALLDRLDVLGVDHGLGVLDDDEGALHASRVGVHIDFVGVLMEGDVDLLGEPVAAACAHEFAGQRIAVRVESDEAAIDEHFRDFACGGHFFDRFFLMRESKVCGA